MKSHAKKTTYVTYYQDSCRTDNHACSYAHVIYKTLPIRYLLKYFRDMLFETKSWRLELGDATSSVTYNRGHMASTAIQGVAIAVGALSYERTLHCGSAVTRQHEALHYRRPRVSSLIWCCLTFGWPLLTIM